MGLRYLPEPPRLPGGFHAPRPPAIVLHRRPTRRRGRLDPLRFALGAGGEPRTRRTIGPQDASAPRLGKIAGLPSLRSRIGGSAPAPLLRCGSGKPHKENGGGPEIVVSPPGFPHTPIRAPLSTRHRHGGNLLAASRLQGTRRRRHIRRIRFPPNRIRSSRSFRRTAPPPCPPCAFAPEGGASVAV